MSPIGRFFKKAGHAVGNFFKKDVAKPVGNFFKKGGVGQQVLRGISTGLGTVSNVAGNLAKSPLLQAGLAANAPELLPALGGLALGSELAKQGSQATDIKNYRGQNSMQVQRNILERAKAAENTANDPKYKFY
jgi:hypothetical protein